MNTQHSFPNAGEEVDRLLSAFYRSEMPKNWPAAPKTSSEPLRPQQRVANSHSVRSRWALAASVAILVGGCWYMSGHMTNGKPHTDRNFDGGDADSKKLLKDLNKGPKNK